MDTFVMVVRGIKVIINRILNDRLKCSSLLISAVGWLLGLGSSYCQSNVSFV